jgi:hypothetical protein
MIVEVAVISVQGREYLTGECIKALSGRGGLNDMDCRRRVYWSGTYEPPKFPGWEVVSCPIDRPASLSLLRVLEGTQPGHDLLFFEDDVIPCRNAVVAASRVIAPITAGLISFYDYRCEWKSPGLFVAPKKRVFWGSQAVKFSASVIERLIPLLIDRCKSDLKAGRITAKQVGWDTWIGKAVEGDLGLDVLHYSPTLFQHGGAKWSIANQGSKHPYAENFPGEEWDALSDCPDPVPSGPFTEYFRECRYHRVKHPGGVVCRYWPIKHREGNI